MNGMKSVATATDPNSLLDALQRHARATREVRRGICLLNAGAYNQAADAFMSATRLGSAEVSLPSLLAACHAGLGHHGDAATQFALASEGQPHQVATRIRMAHALHAAGKRAQAIDTLRESIADNSEVAELHFQLGTLLTEQEDHEEAELRFTQAVNLDPQHTEALVSLALCCGVRQAPDEALKHLQKAQTRRPRDARIGMLLAYAAKAAGECGFKVGICAAMPDSEATEDRHGMEELSGVIEREPDFVDALLSLPVEIVDERLYATLLATIQLALERQPEHAELHFHCGQVLERLGRRSDAIDANERAVAINPRFTRALIELGRLYQDTDRHIDATARLEQAIEAGAAYADVYYMLGNVYRDRGQLDRAREAYVGALRINGDYGNAKRALEALPV